MSDTDLARRYHGRLIFGPFTAVRPDEIAALENEVERPLPPEYRGFIEVAAGGTLPYSVRVPPRPDGEVIGFDELFPVEDLVQERRKLGGTVFADALTAQGISPDAALPIARDGGGSTLFLDLSPDGYGRVLGYVLGLPGWAGSTDTDMAGVLADDCHGYLDSLFVDEDLAEDTWEEVAELEDTEPWRMVVEEWLDGGLPGWRTHPWATR